MGQSAVKHILFCAAAVWAFCSNTLAADTSDKSNAQITPTPLVALLRDHIARAKVYDPQYRFAIESAGAQEKGVQYAESLLRPKISLNATSSQADRTELSTNFFGTRTEQNNRINSSILTIQARQSLYKPRDVVGVRQAESQRQLAVTNVKIAHQDLLQRLVTAWIEVFYTQDLRDVALESLQAAKEILSEAEKRYSSGDFTIQEVKVSQSRVATAEALVHESDQLGRIAQEAVKRIVGPEAAFPKNLKTTLRLSSSKPRLESLESSMQAVISKNFDIAAASEKVEIRRYEREKVSKEYRPVIEAFASASRGQNDTVSFIKDENRFGVQLTVPIYTFGTISSAIAQADALYRAELALLRDIELRSSFEVAKAHSEIASLERRIEALDAEQQALTISLSAQLKGLVAGVNSRAEVSRTAQERANVSRQGLLTRKQLLLIWIESLTLEAGLDEARVESIIRRLFR
jgi:outer membrane protein TolC